MKFADAMLPTRRTVLRESMALMAVLLLAAFSFTDVKDKNERPLPATLADFHQPGTQPGMLLQPLMSPLICRDCHLIEAEDANDNELVGPYDNWLLSMEGQSSRDPVWRAALAIANQDVDGAGEFCIRCHSPMAWLSGHSCPPDESAFTDDDWHGVACIVCHRMVDPVYNPENPWQDSPITLALSQQGLLPKELGNARFALDPYDSRRGPLNDIPLNMHGVPIVVSQFHSSDSSDLCGVCHDAGNVIYSRQDDGTFELNDFGAEHPTHRLRDMPPIHRTYSEWLNSDFAAGGVYFKDRRFGGEPVEGFVQTCNDCHMVRHDGAVCNFWVYPPFQARRGDIADHSFIGANTWVLNAVYDMHRENNSGLTPEALELKAARTDLMLQNASDMTLWQVGDRLDVRITNWSGHKLPTGFPDGQRMWLNVKFFAADDSLIAECGAYDADTAVLHSTDTKVYEVRMGLSEATARAAGLDAGASYHLMLNNVIVKDNRIPPIGFRNEAYAAIQAAPVGCRYEDGQHWDDAQFAVPAGAARAVVTLYYQTTSREYIEFLRDANLTNDAGRQVYEMWSQHGRSAPVEMDMMMIELSTSSK